MGQRADASLFPSLPEFHIGAAQPHATLPSFLPSGSFTFFNVSNLPLDHTHTHTHTLTHTPTLTIETTWGGLQVEKLKTKPFLAFQRLYLVIYSLAFFAVSCFFCTHILKK
jgi:hypothetical protein